MGIPDCVTLHNKPTTDFDEGGWCIRGLYGFLHNLDILNDMPPSHRSCGMLDTNASMLPLHFGRTTTNKPLKRNTQKPNESELQVRTLCNVWFSTLSPQAHEQEKLCNNV